MARMKCGIAAVQALRAAGVSRFLALTGWSTLEICDALHGAKDMPCDEAQQARGEPRHGGSGRARQALLKSVTQ